jgi:hypothetical protein
VDWIWLGGLCIILNIVSILILLQCKKLNNMDETQTIEDVQAIEQSMEAFVAKMEKENDVLYQKLVHYIKEKESTVDERIRILEEKLEAQSASTSLIKQSLEVEQTCDEAQDSGEKDQSGDEKQFSGENVQSVKEEQYSGENEQSVEKNQSSEKVLEEEKISQLYKQGFSPKQIAKVLQMEFGKVELIINLFKKRQGYPK